MPDLRDPDDYTVRRLVLDGALEELERLRRMALHYELHAVNDYDDWLREEFKDSV